MVYVISTEQPTIEWGLTGAERIAQNVLNIFRTKKYEVPFMRDMGIDPDYIDETNMYVYNNLTDELIDLAKKYEPRAVVTDINIEHDDNGNLIITSEVEV